MGEDKSKLVKLRQEASYNGAGDKLKDVVLLYEDKTYILFGPKKKKVSKG